MQACSSKVCSEMSSARPVGCERRRLAILAHGGSRQTVYGVGNIEALPLEILREERQRLWTSFR